MRITKAIALATLLGSLAPVRVELRRYCDLDAGRPEVRQQGGERAGRAEAEADRALPTPISGHAFELKMDGRRGFGVGLREPEQERRSPPFRPGDTITVKTPAE